MNKKSKIIIESQSKRKAEKRAVKMIFKSLIVEIVRRGLRTLSDLSPVKLTPD